MSKKENANKIDSRSKPRFLKSKREKSWRKVRENFVFPIFLVDIALLHNLPQGYI